ncbi:solute carrier organic anion transporter family member 4A1 [Latimeria chalumnae]|uniref:solute carrier organic anion transporter family member 4A1 n=1 Tax=Latimeria chalumnae TaxID=7897 RepID=UPI00313BF94A
MPLASSEDASFSSKQELLSLSGSSPNVDGSHLLAAGSLVICNTPLCNGTLPSGTPSPSDPREKAFANGTSNGNNLYNNNNIVCEVNYVTAEPEMDSLCGWAAFKPKCLQIFNTPKWVLFFLCIASFLQGMIVNGFINTVITSIERQFDLRSYHSGLIASSYDIAACVCLTFVSYFGGNGHKPQWLGFGVMIMAAGSFVFSLPHFTAKQYEVSLSEQMDICHTNQTTVCADSASSLPYYRYVFMVGQFLHGIGATPLYTLGVTYLDENVKSNYSPVYIAIFYTAAIIGPAAGYLLGGMFLNIYTEIGTVTDLTPENPLWVGAWWIGFLVGGAAAFLVSIPILAYPVQLPGSQRYVVMRVSEAHQLKDGSQKTASDPDFGKTLKDLPRSILLLLKNPTFIFLCLAGATEATLIAGMSTFGPKFLESQFSLSASEAATLFGYLVVPAGGGGTFLGGFIVKKLKLRCGGIIRLCVLCALISLLAIFVFLIHCPNMPVAGVTASYNGSTWSPGSLNLTAACNTECNCLQEIYNPVCGADDVMYFSPCHAGCTRTNTYLTAGGRKGYQGCSCIAGNISWPGQAESGKCSSSCQHMPLFMVFLFVVILFTFLCSIPALTATLRCVPDSQRSFGLGIQWIVVRTLGGIPGPIAFGSVIDISCLLWQDQCGDQGSCYLYQNSAMSWYTLIAGLVYKALGLMFFFSAWLLYKPPPPSPTSSSENVDKEDSNPPEKDLPAEI